MSNLARTDSAGTDSGVTEDAVLGGRVRLRQPRNGLRASIDPVLLAAAIPARPGDRVLEAGSGSGVASLCVLARVAGSAAVGVEVDATLAALSEQNAATNRWGGRFRAIIGAVPEAAVAQRVAEAGPFQHAFANPPFNPIGMAPAAGARRTAMEAETGLVAAWITFLARRVMPKGSIAMILPPARLEEAIGAMVAARVGSLVVLPIFPRQGEPARRLIVAGRKAGRAPTRVLSGLVLHQDGGAFSCGAEAILREAASIPLWPGRAESGRSTPSIRHE